MEKYSLTNNIQTTRSAEMIKAVPQDSDVRRRIRAEARRVVKEFDFTQHPQLDTLYQHARKVLRRLQLPQEYLGFAIVAVDNAVWAPEFEATPFDERLLLLPKCLSDADNCRGYYDAIGLHCAGCGSCEIADLIALAESLDYEIIVAEGTSSVIMRVLQGRANALLGVACMDSLEKSFEQISELRIPHQAIPLLRDGCKNTTAEYELIRGEMGAERESLEKPTRSYLPLLRYAGALFEPDVLDAISPLLHHRTASGDEMPQTIQTHNIARDWLLAGGKRLRPFITVAAYAAGAYGQTAVSGNRKPQELIPEAVRRLAVAIEIFHKASLVHDDIADAHETRYGRPTLHNEYDTAIAVNVGDYLIGLGYQLLSELRAELGTDCAADIIRHISQAHVALCSGQGAEQIWARGEPENLKAIDALQIGAHKTAPAFETALFAGLRPANVNMDGPLLHKFATYIGEGYQVFDDLREWDEAGESDDYSVGEDALAQTPTILRAFATEAGAAEELAQIIERSENQDDRRAAIERIRNLYERVGAFDRAEMLYDRLRQRAKGVVADVEHDAIADFLLFAVRMILPDRRRIQKAAR